MNTRRAAGLLVLLLLGGCGGRHPQAVPDGHAMTLIVPADLQTCRLAPAPPAALPKVHGVRSLLAHDRATEAARAGAVAARDDCAAKLSRLLEWIAERMTEGKR